jgi:hypothetical protein
MCPVTNNGCTVSHFARYVNGEENHPSVRIKSRTRDRGSRNISHKNCSYDILAKAEIEPDAKTEVCESCLGLGRAGFLL